MINIDLNLFKILNKMYSILTICWQSNAGKKMLLLAEFNVLVGCAAPPRPQKASGHSLASWLDLENYPENLQHDGCQTWVSNTMWGEVEGKTV